MEIASTTPLRVLKTGTYDSPEQAERKRNTGGRPIVHADGSLVRYADFFDDATQSIVSMSIAQSAIVNDLEPGQEVLIRCTLRVDERAVPNGKGDAFIRRTPKLQLLEAKPAPVAAVK